MPSIRQNLSGKAMPTDPVRTERHKTKRIDRCNCFFTPQIYNIPPTSSHFPRSFLERARELMVIK